MARLLKTLADETRLRLIALLVSGEVCVCHLQESLGIPQPKASRHLAYLRRLGLVAARKEGLWVYYSLARPEDPVLRTILGAILHGMGHLSAIALDRERLARITGCCVPGSDGVEATLDCCGSAGRGADPIGQAPAAAP